MRRATGSLCALLLAGCAAGGASVRERQDPFPVPEPLALRGRQLNLGVGVRAFEDEDFGKLDDQPVFALDYIEPMDLGSLRLEGGLHFVYDEADGTFQGQDVRLKSETLELSVGLNYCFLVGRLRPYVGAGGALQFLNLRGIDAEELVEFDDDDVAPGLYLKGGFLLQITPNSHVGVEFRRLVGDEVTLDGVDLSTSYDQVMLLFGTSFAPEPPRVRLQP